MNEANEQARLAAKKIIKNLAADILDRGGLGDEWIQISPDVMKGELVPAWTKIITNEIVKASGRKPEAVQNAGDIAGSISATGSVACDQQLIDSLMDAATKLTEASDKATLAGLKVTMAIGEHIRIPGPSCQSVIVDVERVSVRARYTPNTGRKYGGH
jgi:hypothetical protein